MPEGKRKKEFEAFSLFEFDKDSDFDKNFCAKALLCLLNVFITPFLLVGRSIVVYLLPYIGVSLQTWLCCLCSPLLNMCKFTDKNFPPNNSSLNINDGREQEIIWLRLSDIDFKNSGDNEATKVHVLFDGRIEVSDISQGSLGDCWLLAAFATLCERPAFILACFVTRTFNYRGKYTIRLFDKKLGRFIHVSIDDYVPCHKDTKEPIFTNLVKNEIWPLLLEKAYAKYEGSYGAIEGGNPIVALKTLTGYEGETFVSGVNANFDDAFCTKMQKLHDRGCLLAAGTKGQDKSLTEGRGSSGIQGGHAYSILDIKTPQLTTSNPRLLKLRNPWGEFEWTGDWGDDSALWKTHPGVALMLGRPDKVDNGVFYMDFKDFTRYFDMVNVLYPEYGVNDLHYCQNDFDGKCSWCAPLCGLVTGCSYFWCACKGCRVLWFQQDGGKTHMEESLQDNSAVAVLKGTVSLV